MQLCGLDARAERSDLMKNIKLEGRSISSAKAQHWPDKWVAAIDWLTGWLADILWNTVAVFDSTFCCGVPKHMPDSSAHA